MPTFIKPGFWQTTCNPCNGYKGWLNLDQFLGGTGTSGTSGITGTAGTSGGSGTAGSSGTTGLSGSSGSSGRSGTSGLSGDRYKSNIVGSFTLGTTTSFTIGTGLAYTPAQDVIISYDNDNHEVCNVVSYNSGTGAMVIGPPVTVVGSGTYTGMVINLNGAAGGDGSSGTSGSAGTSGYGTSGTSGAAGTSGSAGTSGANGSSGVSGTSGASGSSGVSGTSGTSPVFPLPLVYGLYAQTANSTTITGTAAETTLIGPGVGTLTVGANQFSIGDSFRVDLAGLISTANSATLRLRLKAGSVILADSGAQLVSNVTSNVWTLSVNFTIRALGAAGVASIVSLGRFGYNKTVNGTTEGFAFNTVNNTTFDTTVSNTLDMTLEFNTASGTNNAYSDIFVLNKIY